MIVLPWYVRFGIDCIIIATPFWYVNKHPILFFEYFANKRRIQRRKTFDDINIKQNPQITLQQSKSIFKELKMQI